MAKGYYDGKNVLVTGITGLVGSWLADRLLKEDANVIGIVRDDNPYNNYYSLNLGQKVITIHGDVSDIAFLERVIVEYECSIIFHLAAQAMSNPAQRSPLSTFETNMRGTWNLLEVLRRVASAECMILLSSGDIYSQTVSPPFDEKVPLSGIHPSEVSKMAADMLTQSYHNIYQLPVGIARSASVYGGGDLHFERLIPCTIRSILMGENPLLRSDGIRVREYIFIDDLVEGLIRLGAQLRSQELEGEAFNITSGEAMSDLEVVENLLSKMNNSGLRPVILSQNYNEPAKVTLNGEKAGNLLGFVPKYKFDEAIRKVIPWYESYLHKNTNPL